MLRSTFIALSFALLVSSSSQADSSAPASPSFIDGSKLMIDLIDLYSKIPPMSADRACSLFLTHNPQDSLISLCKRCVATTEQYAKDNYSSNDDENTAPSERSVFADLHRVGSAASNIKALLPDSDPSSILSAQRGNANLAMGQIAKNYLNTWNEASGIKANFLVVDNNLDLAKKALRKIAQNCAPLPQSELKTDSRTDAQKEFELENAVVNEPLKKASAAIKTISDMQQRVESYFSSLKIIYGDSAGAGSNSVASQALLNTQNGTNLGALDGGAGASSTVTHGGQSTPDPSTTLQAKTGTNSTISSGATPAEILDPAGTGTGLSTATNSVKADISADQAQEASDIVKGLGAATVNNGKVDLSGYSIDVAPKAKNTSISDSTLTSIINLCSTMANGNPDIFAQCTDERNVNVTVH